MRSRAITFCYFFLTALTSSEVLAQKLLVQENRLSNLYSKLLSVAQTDFDSASVYSDRFENELTKFITTNPETLTHPFKKLLENCWIQTSRDGNFRIYSWDTRTGGTMHFFREIHQWRSNGKVFTKIPSYGDGDPGSFCSKIFTVEMRNQSFYFVVTNGVFSTKDAAQSIATYMIEKNNLVDTVKVFKTKTKKLSRIDVGFDFFSVADRPERPLELITYDDKLKIIYVPVVDEKGQVSQKNILYQLKERYFEFIGIEVGYRK